MTEKEIVPTSVDMKNFQKGKDDMQSQNGISLVFPNDKREEAEGYDPSKYRNLDHPTSDLDTLIHLVKGSLGSGILAMPSAFSHAGLAMGSVCTILVGVICTHCIHILIKSAHILYRRNRIPSLGLAELAEASFLAGPKSFHPWARTAKFTIHFVLVLDLMGSCAVYVGLISLNLKQVVDVRTKMEYDIRIYMAVILVPLILSNLVRHLKYLLPFSLIANVLMAVGLGITFYYLCQDIPSLDDRPKFVEVQQFPLFFGTVIFALEAIGVMMPLENNMKSPSHFIGCPGVLNIAMTIIISLYTLTGFLGFLKYGDQTKTAITLNLNENETLAQSVKVMIAIAIFFTYTIQFYVPMEILWQYMKPKFTKRANMAEYMLRISLVTFTVILAILVPSIGGLMSLVGAVTLSLMGLIFPAIIETLVIYEKPGLGIFSWRLYKNIFLAIFGIIGFLAGSYASLKEIIESE